MIVSRYVYSKLRWNLSTYEVSETWTTQNLDSIVKTYVKRWLRLHYSANFRHLHLPIKNCPVSVNGDSKLWRHNSILNTLHHYVSQLDGFDIFVDLLSYQYPSNIIHDAVRPDLVLKRNGHIIVIELTYCFETKLVY